MVNGPPVSASLGALSSQRWWRMTLKELREILRDRRTIITLVGMPLLIYPLLGVTFQKLLVSQATSKAKTEYKISVCTRSDSKICRQLFRQYDALQAGHTEKNGDEPIGTPDDPLWAFLEPNEQNTVVDVDQFVADGTAAIGIRFISGADKGPWNVIISYRTASNHSLDARRLFEDRLVAINQFIISQKIRELDPLFVPPITFSKKAIQSTDIGSQFSMATLIPLILILMTVTGAVYPAIDLTAGERERGTLEALISAPVPRHELLFAKFLAVLTVAMLTALANLISMVITAYSNGMEQLLFGSGGVNIRMLALMLGLLLVFAGFFASVILILTSFARSFKEAQAYLIPVMLVSLAPGVLCLLPGIEMTGFLSVTPLVNIVILARDVVDGRAQLVWVVTSLMSTVLYSAVALATAAKIFGTDAVLYGSEGSWADLFRRPSIPLSAASLSQAMTCLAFIFPTLLICSGLPARLGDNSVIVSLIGNAIITVILFAVFPFAFARITGVDIVHGFRMFPASGISFVAAVIFGLSLWPFAIELARLLSNSFEQSEAIKKLFEQLVPRLNTIPVPAKLLALALIPAVCEELFFRGYLLTSFRSGMSAALAISLSSILFGLFHVIPTLAISNGFERFVPTCFLGLILGCICYRTESVFPGMLLHATHNSLLLLMQTYSKELSDLGIGNNTDQQVPAIWLASAAVAVAVASIMLTLVKRRSPEAFTAN